MANKLANNNFPVKDQFDDVEERAADIETAKSNLVDQGLESKFITLREILNGRNDRVIPYDFKVFERVEWPDLSLSESKASARHREIIEGELKDIERNGNMSVDDAVESIDSIRSIAISISLNGVIQPPYVHKKNTEKGEVYTCLGGNRRICALHYIKEKASLFVCNSREMSESELLSISNGENNERENLKFHEQISLAKHSYEVLCRENTTPSIDNFKQITGFSRSKAHRLKRIAQSENYDLIYRLARLNVIKISSVEKILDNTTALQNLLDKHNLKEDGKEAKSKSKSKSTNNSPFRLTRNTDLSSLNLLFEIAVGSKECSEELKLKIENAIGKDHVAMQTVIDSIINEEVGS